MTRDSVGLVLMVALLPVTVMAGWWVAEILTTFLARNKK